MIETLDKANVRLVVVTFSFCSAYWEDLWDLNPDVLIVDSGYEHDFANALRRAHRGEKYRVLPKILSEKVECRLAERRNRGERGRARPTRRAKVVA